MPVSGQKMICSGKQLNTGEGWIDKSIKEVSATKVEQPDLTDQDHVRLIFDCILTVLTRLDLRLAAR